MPTASQGRPTSKGEQGKMVYFAPTSPTQRHAKREDSDRLTVHLRTRSISSRWRLQVIGSSRTQHTKQGDPSFGGVLVAVNRWLAIHCLGKVWKRPKPDRNSISTACPLLPGRGWRNVCLLDWVRIVIRHDKPERIEGGGEMYVFWIGSKS